MAQEVVNPYRYRAPIEDRGAFFGRVVQLEFAREHIGTKECVSFVGEPHSGLSSLLNRMIQPDFRQACEADAGALKFILVNCASFKDPLPFIAHIVVHLTPERPLPKLPNWRPAFTRLIGAVKGLEQTRVVILLDDFEHMGSSELFVDFCDAMRGLVISADITLITTTHKVLHKCCHADVAVSPFPNIFRAQYMGAFSAEEAHQLLTTTSANSGVDLVPYAEQLLELGGCFPYFLQMACWHYYEALTRGGMPDHAALAEQFMVEAGPEFARIWESLEAGEQKALRDLANGGQVAGNAYDDLEIKGYVMDGCVFSSAFRGFVAEKT
jgi:eukaryotic-like serine/threonine-protein kinase